MAEQTKITALDNGPYLVKGPVVVVVDAEATGSLLSGRL